MGSTGGDVAMTLKAGDLVYAAQFRLWQDGPVLESATVKSVGKVAVRIEGGGVAFGCRSSLSLPVATTPTEALALLAEKEQDAMREAQTRIDLGVTRLAAITAKRAEIESEAAK
jgi:hypothetical protein